ncbi:MAG: transglutaminase family protein [Candidatus Aenigmatarchaeota archaeon]
MKNGHGKWLKLDGQLKTNKRIEKISRRFGGSEKDKIKQIVDWISNNLKYPKGEKGKEGFEEEFMKRDVSEIVNSGYVRGCTDISIVFVTLARLNGIPTKWLYLVDSRLILEGNISYAGHGIARCFFDNEWHLVDPTGRWGVFWSKIPEWFNVYYEGQSPREAGIVDFDTVKEIIDEHGGIKCHFDLPKDIAVEVLEKSREMNISAYEFIKRAIKEKLK